MTYNSVPPLEDVYCATPIFKISRSIGCRDEEYGVLKVGEDVTPIDPKWGGGYEDVKISKSSGR